jgi:hypothetical protein
MVEENEIRVGLSYYERARVVVKTVEAGVYPEDYAALNALFATASKARRSKIGSFMTVVRDLGDVLRFPEALAEAPGLRVVKFLRTRKGPEILRAALAEAAPETAEAERATLLEAMAGKAKPERRAGEEIAPGVLLNHRKGGLLLSGEGVTPDLTDKLRAWLRAELG